MEGILGLSKYYWFKKYEYKIRAKIAKTEAILVWIAFTNSLLNLYLFWNLAPIILSESVAKNPETTTTIKWYFVEIIDRRSIIKAINIDPKTLANVPSILIPP